ncbi:MAG: DUF6502 family protein [Woeseiaceae bacterium]|nr:DUF6502 family protein [Woeseiaceae bacterium]
MTINKENSLRAFRLLFRPIARILLRAGVTWRELSGLCKLCYVEVASEEFGIRGRPTNMSRVAILTGIARREVKRLRDVADNTEAVSFGHMDAATRVLTGWYTDPDFTDADEQPRRLAAAGNNPSFETLCGRYAGDVPTSTMLKELKHVGAVVAEPDGSLVVRMRYFMPTRTDPELMLSSGSVLQDLGETVAYNLHRGDDDPSRFERRASNTNIPRSALRDFKQFLDDEGQAFLERVDEWLSEHEDLEHEKPVRLGLGMYWIEEHKPERTSSS